MKIHTNGESFFNLNKIEDFENKNLQDHSLEEFRIVK